WSGVAPSWMSMPHATAPLHRRARAPTRGATSSPCAGGAGAGRCAAAAPGVGPPAGPARGGRGRPRGAARSRRLPWSMSKSPAAVRRTG
ncbi:MAG: hypothetical protein AVDCRST_MAG06-2096, partial [uncultured Nocardioides sp.]